MLIWAVRILFFLVVMAVMLLGFREGGAFDFDIDDVEDAPFYQLLAVVGCFCVFFLGIIIDLLVPRKRVYAFAGIFFGVLMGLVFGMLINYILDLIYESHNIQPHQAIYTAQNGIKSMVNILCCYITITFILQTKDDFRFVIPYVEFSKQTKGVMPMIMDTSVIIDGRIADIASTNIINSPLVVPRFVLNELQTIADSADRLKRNRGRRGLDMLNKMQGNVNIDISVQEISLTPGEKSEPVDLQLVSTAKKMNGKIITNDYNLNKVATIRGVNVININDLANALKTVVLPGEVLNIRLIKPGDQHDQGVGYLEDGTMVVVENGRSGIGREVDIMVTSVLQKSSGRMIFGKLDGKQLRG
ncbi:MAG: TRAM domain-containing protein [Sedimentisphaerales bacterium]|nr:TRAM domain-containing protein [Sedimentisphaerales bacterium]